jgi:hypothetical protein
MSSGWARSCEPFLFTTRLYLTEKEPAIKLLLLVESFESRLAVAIGKRV